MKSKVKKAVFAAVAGAAIAGTIAGKKHFDGKEEKNKKEFIDDGTLDIELNYTEKGEGDVLILLHGNSEDHTYFSSQIEYFSCDHRVIAIDTRWHGQSLRGVKPFTLKQFAVDLHDFMTEHGIKKADILGFSDGGNIALYFALRYPGMVRKLILNGANLYPSGLNLKDRLPDEAEYRKNLLKERLGGRHRRRTDMLSLMINEPDIKPEDLDCIDIPVLVIAGSEDMIKEKHTRLIYDSLPNAQLAIIGGDHFIASGKADEFNKIVELFLAE